MNRKDVKLFSTKSKQNDVAIRHRKTYLKKNWNDVSLFLDIAFVRNDPHATRTAGW